MICRCTIFNWLDLVIWIRIWFEKENMAVDLPNKNIYQMMTSSNGNIFRVTGHLCGEFTGEFPTQRPVTRSFDVFIDLRLYKRLSKQS